MKRKLSALLCIGLPFLLGICLLIMFVIASILEAPTDRGRTYTIIFSVSLIGSMLMPIPSIASSVVGIISAARVQGKQAVCLTVVGICNIIVSLTVAAFWLYAIFIGSAGV